MSDPRPVLLVTSTVADYRREPFRLLAEREEVEVAAHDDAGPPVPGLRLRATSQRGAARLAASGRYRAVICGLGGRVALPACFAAARAARIPFVLWASLWGHPRTPAHLLSFAPTVALYRGADAVVTYGPHVSDYVRRWRGEGNVFEAPQAVDPELFAAATTADRHGVDGGFLLLFAGRLEREKGVEVLLEAWARAGLDPEARLVLAGAGPLARPVAAAAANDSRIRPLGHVPRERLPALYAAAQALVLPSVRTATFLEPWGLVINEAMHQGTPIIASDAVGAVAGGLVRGGRNGLVVPAGDPLALAARIRALAGQPDLCVRLGAAAKADVAPYTPDAWARGMSRALAAVEASRC